LNRKTNTKTCFQIKTVPCEALALQMYHTSSFIRIQIDQVCFLNFYQLLPVHLWSSSTTLTLCCILTRHRLTLILVFFTAVSSGDNRNSVYGLCFCQDLFGKSHRFQRKNDKDMASKRKDAD